MGSLSRFGVALGARVRCLKDAPDAIHISQDDMKRLRPGMHAQAGCPQKWDV